MATQEKPRINATKPENLNSSAKRTGRAALLAQYSQLLPLLPTPPPSFARFLSAPTAALAPARLDEIDAEWDDISQSVWVKREQDMTRLWRQGFFGKGFLSRSEPSWKRRVENRRAEFEGREKSESSQCSPNLSQTRTADLAPHQAELTAEEITVIRRLERKGAKLAKKLERDAEKLAAASVAASSTAGDSSTPGTPTPSTSSTLVEDASGREAEEDELAHDMATAQSPIALDKGKARADAEVPTASIEPEADDGTEAVPPEEWQLDAEHSQLQPEEAFFLSFAVGCLAVKRATSGPSESESGAPLSRRLSMLDAFRLFLESAVPLIPSPAPSPSLPPSSLDPRLNRLDSPFLLSYAAYHHFRSMGWVTRSGTKFCVDWVLYGQGGPVGGHAEFAVVIVPTYVDPRDAQSNPFRSTSTLAVHSDPEMRAAVERAPSGDSEHLQGEGERKNSWRWFHTINRVCSGVKKTMVLLYVVIPPLSSLPDEPDWVARHPAQALAKFEMREVVVRRFLAGRMRD
ncbi:hypothetical protein BMF94_3531 [Rhodotorula taiwanensis]|uniref:tRNA-intron lyase n=1 Tax=Rhodotorula taiwanensis TaxID=741276 RepID=A0A2S5B8U8_9BASI|nr:hypothetical protein BMF94_3531 [Rhodotorula taiwanensis]